MIQLRTQNDLARLEDALRPVIAEVVQDTRAEQRREQQRRRVAAQKYRKQQRAAQYRRKQAAMTDSEREADVKARMMQTMFQTAQASAQAQAIRDQSAKIRAQMAQPLAIRARELALASREAGRPMSYETALRLVGIRAKQRYSKPKSEGQLLQAATKYVEARRKEGINLPLMTGLKHIKLGLV
jgi:hypothetical protein